MTSWKTEMLGDLCEILIGRTPSRSEPRYWRGGTQPWLSIADMSQGTDLVETKERITNAAVAECGGKLIPSDTLVMSFKLSVGKLGFLRTPMYTNEAIAALPIRRGKRLDSRFLYRTLQVARLSDGADRAVMGLTLNSEKLARVPVSYPDDLDEQRRIADILDRADAIRRKRKEAITLTSQLLRSTFLEMFGDPVTNPKRLKRGELRDFLLMPLRNGLSPATGGRYKAQLLTLSAITRGAFDGGATKEGVFAADPWPDVRLDERDFLVCRGNGNRDLVGAGAFPDRSDPSVVFPDTMIAARVDPRRVGRAFLDQLWKSRLVRAHVEASARTTNGTFKVNQGAVEATPILLPEAGELARFESFALRQRMFRARLVAVYEDSEALFESLVSCAFQGELSSVSQ